MLTFISLPQIDQFILANRLEEAFPSEEENMSSTTPPVPKFIDHSVSQHTLVLDSLQTLPTVSDDDTTDVDEKEIKCDFSIKMASTIKNNGTNSTCDHFSKD